MANVEEDKPIRRCFPQSMTHMRFLEQDGGRGKMELSTDLSDAKPV